MKHKLIMENWRAYCALAEQKQYNFYERDYDKNPLTDEELEVLAQDTDVGINARTELLAHIYDYNEIPDFSPDMKSGSQAYNKIVDLAKEKGKEISDLGQNKVKKKQGYKSFDSSQEYANPDAPWEFPEDVTDKKLNQNCWINLLTHYSLKGENGAFCLLEIHNDSLTDITYGIIDASRKRKTSSELFLEILNNLLPEAEENDQGEVTGLGDYDGTYGFRKRWERLEGNSKQYTDRYSFCPLDNTIVSSYNNFNLARDAKRYVLMPLNEEYKIVFFKKNRNRNSPPPTVIDIEPLVRLGPGEGRGSNVSVPSMTVNVSPDFGDIDLEDMTREDQESMAQNPRYGLRDGTDKYRFGQDREEEALGDHIGFETFSEAKLKNLIRNTMGR
jgi:hypothetical protein